MKKFKLEVSGLKKSQTEKIINQIGIDRCLINPYIKKGLSCDHLIAEKLTKEEVKKILALS